MRPTKTFESVHVDTRFVRLAPGARVLSLAENARDAALSFVSMSRYGWGRVDLAKWLVSEYRPATIEVGATATRPTFASMSSDATGEDLLDETVIARLVSRARGRAIDLVATASSTWTVQGFAREMVDAGLVVGVSDEQGSLGYAAVHRASMRLADRVLSLFLADFLTRPADYRSLVVCSSCSEVSFAWDEVHEIDCDARGPVSGIIVKRPRFTRLGLGERR